MAAGKGLAQWLAIEEDQQMRGPHCQDATSVSRGSFTWGANPRGERVPGFCKLPLQVLSNNRVFKVVILCPVDAKLLVVQDQFQDGLKSLSCAELRLLAAMLPGIDCQELQGILLWQGLPKLLLTLRGAKRIRNVRLSSWGIKHISQRPNPACHLLL